MALPITEEAGGDLRLFTIGPRLTPHVRHREKYVDVPVTEHRAFVFGGNGHGSFHRAHTLRQFVAMLEGASPAALDPYVRRGDFSRWIGDVFGDYPLAEELRALEARHRGGAQTDTIPGIATAVRARYDLLDDDITACATTP